MRLWLWRNWCFLRVLFWHFRVRLLLMLLILIGGSMLFMSIEQHSFWTGLHYSWLLVFGEPPEELPESPMLAALFFIMPVLGLTVIIEFIIDVALMVRDRRRAERSWCTMLASSYRNHIVLVGCGKLGYRVYLVLRKLGEQVVVIERDPNNQFLEELRRDGSPVLIGDARREALLDEANLAKARSVVLATNDDLANLEIALDAQRINSQVRVVVRMFDQNMADKLSGGFNIHLAMSQSAISAPTFALSAVAPSIVSSVMIGQHLVVMQRWQIRQGGSLAGLTVGQVIERYGLGVMEHVRPPGEAQLFPPPSTVLEPGDGVVLQGPLHVLDDLLRRNIELVEEAETAVE